MNKDIVIYSLIAIVAILVVSIVWILATGNTCLQGPDGSVMVQLG
ncbi:MAG TPA: hypothetical protein VJB12_02720 [Candidatus Nanoarchaeia archaeon]|nr:hypothetical protein [Candidatus Nanoarchaeia archaeon]